MPERQHKSELKLRGTMQRLCAISVVERAAVAAGAEGDAPIAAAADRPFRIKVSSEVPVLRYDWDYNPFYEVLGHSAQEVDLARFKAGAAVRDTHLGDQVGSLADPELAGKELSVAVGFMKSVKGQEYDQGVRDGHIQNVSIGYEVGPAVPAGFADDGIPIYRFSWMPYHTAMVPDPADFKVGFGRDGDPSIEARTVPVQTQGATPKEERTMIIRKPLLDGAPDIGGGGGGGAAAAATIDVGAERKSAVEAERERCSDIENFAEAAGIGRDQYSSWIREGMSVRDAAVKIREIRSTKGVAQPGAEKNDRGALGYSEKDAAKYDSTRALRISATLRGVGGFQEKADGIEREAHDECVKRMGPAPHGGMYLPWRLSDVVKDRKGGRTIEEIRLRSLQGRTMGSTVGGGGAETIYETHRELLEYLVPKTALIMAGVPVSTLDGPVSWAKETNDVDGYWTSENPPAGVADTEMTFGTVNMSLRTLMATMKWPRQLAMQSSLDMRGRANSKMAGKIARLLDKGGLHGSGSSGQVTGIFNTTGVNVSAALAGVGTWAKFIQMTGKVADVDADQFGDQGWLTTTLYAAALAAAQKVSGQAAMLWPTDPGTIRESTLVGYRAASTNQVSKVLGSGADEHGIVFGSYSQAEFGMSPAVEAILDEVTLATYAQLRLTLFQGADFVVKYPQAFCIGDGAKPA